VIMIEDFVHGTNDQWWTLLVSVCPDMNLPAPGMFHTVIWDVQYGEIRIKNAIHIILLVNFGSAEF